MYNADCNVYLSKFGCVYLWFPGEEKITFLTEYIRCTDQSVFERKQKKPHGTQRSDGHENSTVIEQLSKLSPRSVCFNNSRWHFPSCTGRPQPFCEAANMSAFLSFFEMSHPLSHVCLRFSFWKRFLSVFALSMFTWRNLEYDSDRGKL